MERKYITCGLVAIFVAVLAWLATLGGEISFRNEMFVAREASDVYRVITDLTKHKQFHPFLQEAELLRTETSSEGIEERLFRVTDLIPLPLGFRLPLTFEALIKLTKPNEEVLCEFDAGGTKGVSKWTLRPHTGPEDPMGTLITEDNTMQCKWITCGFVRQQAMSSHQQLFHNMKSALESGVVP